MTTLKYKVITSKNQYKEYCNVIEQLVFSGAKQRNTKDEITLLTLLIEKWDAKHIASAKMDPVELIHYFIKEHKLLPLLR